MAEYHPLAPVSTQLDRVPLRRPRFSNNEALILNTLINANGQTVSARKLALMTGVMRASVGSYICSLRAKLGEKAYAPSLIVTEWPSEDNGYETGWKFVE
jgi:hypothetical protein